MNSISVQIQFDIAATPMEVWRVLLEETSRWWDKDFFATPDPEGIFFEARPGGRLYEQCAAGGLLWYTINEIIAPTVLSMSGSLSPPYGGPAISMLRIELQAKSAGCQVKISDHVVGQVDDSSAEAIEDGWRRIFQHGLKSYMEQGK